MNATVRAGAWPRPACCAGAEQGNGHVSARVAARRAACGGCRRTRTSWPPSARGDDRAFEALYERYQRRIAAYVRGMVRDRGRAEDITQEIFMSALRRMRDTERPIAFKPWIYEIAKNACIDAFRRRGGPRRSPTTPTRGWAAPTTAAWSARDADARRRVRGEELARPPARRDRRPDRDPPEILVMRELEGRSYQEIGERLGMSRPAVESTLFRARRRLNEEYEELVSGERCRRVTAIIADRRRRLPRRPRPRSMARHISYCQPCRARAQRAGLDVAALARKPRPRADRGLPAAPGVPARPLAAGRRRRLGLGGSSSSTRRARWRSGRRTIGTHLDPS